MIDLAGDWEFCLDPGEEGSSLGWENQSLPGAVSLPGSLATQKIGDPVTLATPWTGGIEDRAFFTDPAYARYREEGDFRVPFWYQPERHFLGKAWYSRLVEIPSGQSDWTLTLERPHGVTTCWWDGEPVGFGDSLATPHLFSIETTPGQHRLTLCIDNSALGFVGEDAHSISDHTQGNWNGVVGTLSLTPASPRATGLRLIPDLAAGIVTITARVSRPGQYWVFLADLPPVMTEGQAEIAATLAVPDLEAWLWDEHAPRLWPLLITSAEGVTAFNQMVGLRSVATEDKKVCINGKPRLLRGTLECCVFPRTGHPPTDLASWLTLFQTVQAHGLNHVRFHSYCPPQAAFLAADQLGVYLQVEASVWVREKDPQKLGDGRKLDDWLLRESRAILDAYSHHPSFILFCHGNEPFLDKNEDFLAAWVTAMRREDPTKLFSSGAGWPALSEADVHVKFEPRCHAWDENLASRLNATPPATFADYQDYTDQFVAPVIAHEIGQWCTWPDLAALDRPDGTLNPRGWQVFRDQLKANGLAECERDLFRASATLQARVMKEEIESSLRTTDLAGFQWLSLTDFPGQGTAPVGILDDQWQSKGAITAAEFASFTGPIVPLLLTDRRVFTSGETWEFGAQICHFGPRGMTARVSATLDLPNGTKREITWGERELQPGGTTKLPTATLAIPIVTEATRATLAIQVGDDIRNDWSIWIFPAAENPKLPAAEPFDEALVARAEAGESLLVEPETSLDGFALGFTPIFWNTAWTHKQAPHSLGLLIDQNHPLFAHFPSDEASDWHLWYLLQSAKVFDLRDWPGFTPIVQVIDDWFTARPLALVAERKVGKGRILLSGITPWPEPNPVSDWWNESLRRTWFPHL